MEIYDDPDNLNPDTTLNPDEFEPATDKKPKIKTERAGKKLSLIKVAETSGTYDESELISEIFSRAQMKKAIGIARKSAGQYTKAYNEIEKIKKGLADEHIIAAALKRANESTDDVVAEGVDVDRRTVGFKAAMIRREVANKVREKSKLKKEKKKEQEVLDARYDYDGEVDAVLAAANKKIFGETAANSAASGNVDMAPNSRGKKKKKDLKVIRRATY